MTEITMLKNNLKPYIVDTMYKTSIDQLKNKYLVLDVETNGFSFARDDLLSISIYDPSSGLCYNRYLPLEKQDHVLTTFINGITDEMLLKEQHITQQEMNDLIDFFDIKNKIMLSFSGGDGKFDQKFLTNYCMQHALIGLNDITYENIKTPFDRYCRYYKIYASKDNLCKLFNIQGVQNVHSSYNDCILEWKLFEIAQTCDLQKLFLLSTKNNMYNIKRTY